MHFGHEEEEGIFLFSRHDGKEGSGWTSMIFKRIFDDLQIDLSRIINKRKNKGDSPYVFSSIQISDEGKIIDMQRCIGKMRSTKT